MESRTYTCKIEKIDFNSFRLILANRNERCSSIRYLLINQFPTFCVRHVLIHLFLFLRNDIKYDRQRILFYRNFHMINKYMLELVF